MLACNVFANDYVIKGRILPTDSNATVYVIYPHEKDVNQRIAGFATINDSGEYAITVPSFGIYDILVVARGGYINKTLMQIGIKENQVTEIEDIILTKRDNTGSISGFIYPIIAGVEVKIKKFGATEFDGSDIVASDGSYEFIDLEPGTYSLFVQFDGTQNFYDYKWGMIDIIANVSLSGINLTFTPKTSNYLIDRIIVEFNAGVSEKEKRDIIQSYNGTLMSHYSYTSTYTIRIPSDKTVEETVELFKTNSKVKSAYQYGISHIAVPMVESQSKYDPEILEELIKTHEVSITAKLYNQNMTKIDNILSTLPETEFRLKKKLQSGDGFSGNMTLRAYNILIKNQDIKIIYLNEPSRIGEDSGVDIPENDSIMEDSMEREKVIKEKEHKSLFSRLIQFLKTLFRFK